MEDEMSEQTQIKRLSVEQIATWVLGYQPISTKKIGIGEFEPRTGGEKVSPNHDDLFNLLKNTGPNIRRLVHLEAVPQIGKYTPKIYQKERGQSGYPKDFEREIERERVNLAFTQREYKSFENMVAAKDSDYTGNIYPYKGILKTILGKIGFQNNILLHIELKEDNYSIDSYADKLESLEHINPLFA